VVKGYFSIAKSTELTHYNPLLAGI